MARRNTTPQLVTRESLARMIREAQAANDQAKLHKIVGRALVRLFERQTQEEKRRNDTEVNNTVGFAGSDGRQGSIAAKTFLKNGKLEQFQLDAWLAPWRGTGFPKICKYARQLNDVAVRLREQGKGS